MPWAELQRLKERMAAVQKELDAINKTIDELLARRPALTQDEVTDRRAKKGEERGN